MHFNFFFFFFGRAVALRDLSSLIRDWTWVTAVKAQSPKTGSPGNSLKYIFQTACFSVSKTLMFPRRVSGLRGHRILYHWENRNISPNPCKSNCPLNFMLHKMSEILYAFPEELCLRQTNSRPKVLWAAFYCGSLVLSVECFVEDSILWLGTFDISFTQSSWVELRACHCAELPAQESRVRRN